MASCGRDDDDGGQVAPVPSLPVTAGKRKCHKCRTADAVFKFKEAACRECFLQRVEHKFAASLRTEAQLNDPERLLIALSGGACSRSVLHMFSKYTSPVAHRRNRPNIHIEAVFVDETSVLPVSNDERNAAVTAIASICGSYSVRLHVVSVTSVYASVGLTENTGKPTGGVSANLSLPAPLSADGTLPADPFAQHPIHELFRTFRSPTDRQDMLEFLRYRVLADTANQLGFSRVVLGDCQSILAQRVMSLTAKARGSSIAQELKPVDDRFDVQFLRPVKGLSAKDLAIYAHANGLDTVFLPNFLTKTMAKDGGVTRLTQGFVAMLQSKFDSTEPNILRTCEKLDPDHAAARAGIQSVGVCVVCGRSITTLTASKESSSGLGRGPMALLSALSLGATDQTERKSAPDTSGAVLSAEADQVIGPFCFACRTLVGQLPRAHDVPSDLVTSHTPSLIPHCLCLPTSSDVVPARWRCASSDLR